MQRATFLITLFLLSLTLGCGANGKVVPAGKRSYQGNVPAFRGHGAVERFAYDLAMTECEAMFACLPGANASYGLSDFQAATVGDCVRAHLDRDSPALLEAAVDQSRSSFDATSASRCLNDIASASCSAISTIELDPFASLVSCASALTGTGTQGDRCEGSWDCGESLVCDTALGPCQGQCQPPSSGRLLCGKAPCGLDQFCDMGSQTCKPLLAAGQRCLDSSQCSDGRECVSAGGSNPTICKSTMLVADGSHCDDLHLCAPGSICGSKATCVPVSDSGGSCVPGGTAQCAYGLYCANGKCAPHRENGACHSDDECKSGMCVNGSCRPVDTSCFAL